VYDKTQEAGRLTYFSMGITLFVACTDTKSDLKTQRLLD